MLGGFALDGHDVPEQWVEAIGALDAHDRGNGSLTARMDVDDAHFPAGAARAVRRQRVTS